MPDPSDPTGHDPYDHEADVEKAPDESFAREVAGQSAQLNTLSKAAVGRAVMDCEPPTVTEKLLNEKRNLELRLQAINELLDQMERNPATQQIIDGMARLGALSHNY